MPAYLIKNRDEILRQALRKLERDTPITSTAPGSIARALVECLTSELGDMYEILDFNISQQFLSTATGSALDMLGSLYGVVRKTTSSLTTIDRSSGTFFFYIDAPFSQNIVIPKGTNVYTDTTSFIGQQYSYTTTADAIIPIGRTRAFTSIKPSFTDSVFTAGVNKLVIHDFQSPAGTIVKCKNVKQIQAQIGFETDDGYRLRIIKSIRVSSGGTADAIRFAGLSVPGVRDVRTRQAPYGLGSFEVIVVPEDYNNANALVDQVSTVIDAVRPIGVRAFVKKPLTRSVDLTFSLIVPNASAPGVVENIVERARVGAARYIASLLPGDTLVYNRLVQILLDSSDAIRDVIMDKFAVSGTESARRNFQPEADQQLVPGTIAGSIAKA